MRFHHDFFAGKYLKIMAANEFEENITHIPQLDDGRQGIKGAFYLCQGIKNRKLLNLRAAKCSGK